MATYTELKRRAEYLVDDIVTDELMWINECLEDLSESAGLEKNALYEFVAESEVKHGGYHILLPEDFIDVSELVVLETDSPTIRTNKRFINRYVLSSMAYPLVETSGYQLTLNDANKRVIWVYPTFKNAIQVSLRYECQLPKATNLTETPMLPQQYHKLIALYLAFKYFQNAQGELETKNDYFSEYTNGKRELKEYVSSKKQRYIRKTLDVKRSWW